MTSALLRVLTNSDEHLKFVSKLLDDSVDKTDIYKFVHGEIIKGFGDAIKKDSPSTYLFIKGKYSIDKYGELIDYFKSKAIPFKSAEKSVGELTVDKSFLDEVSKSLNEEPIMPEVEQVKPEVSAGVKPIPKELEPLAEEARKYKSAEEFINNEMQPIFRGGKINDGVYSEGNLGGGVYLTDNKEITKNFAGSENFFIEEIKFLTRN